MAERRTFPTKTVIVTDKATLHVTIEPFKDRNTNNVEHYSVSIGSRKSKCIHITVPGGTSGEGTLSWVSKMVPECYLTANDTSKLSQHIVNLAFTIARDINPSCTRYRLDDCSSFPCKLPNGTEYAMPMKQFHIAFHGGTWYECYFGAKLLHSHEIYERGKLNLYNSSKKPAKFSFNHRDLEEILRPLYTSTSTWWEFFQAIQTKYGDKKCSVIYPWINNAMYAIFESAIIEDKRWYVDFVENERAVKTPLIPFRSYEDVKGGRRITRKQTNKKTYTPYYTYKLPPMFPYNYFVVQAMDYRTFLKEF
jgi:hypothetical protein